MLQLHPLKERGHGASAGAAEGVRPLAGCGRGRGMGATEGGAVGGACGGVELLDELPPPGQSLEKRLRMFGSVSLAQGREREREVTSMITIRKR